MLQVYNHGSSVAHAGFLSEKQVFALSHDEKFAIYSLSYQESSADAPPIDYGDLRPRLKCEYVCGLLVRSNGSAVVGAGSQRCERRDEEVWLYELIKCSEHRMDLIPLNARDEWNFNEECTIRLEGAHGEDIVRSFHIDEEVRPCFYQSGAVIDSRV